ncbi:hypothetical protein Q5H93_15630 [Hymenobacter sp. ASUV-10]|uniref:J domain-containing protein n=1 Tax=Hymenobacter aranciens TaxID=3063996 RepID=A0ABT9BEI4_9BACT|nr:hypothetical protein [Hymenobacter sp. ASUV-10]MDO7876175.1 hypothetical protein [Hymenobacter sp. ASUV-10]
MTDYYRLLGLAPDATATEITRAIRRYTRRVPLPPGPVVQRAIRVLDSPRLREAYDAARLHTPAIYPLHLRAEVKLLRQQVADQQKQLQLQRRQLHAELDESARLRAFGGLLEDNINRLPDSRQRLWRAIALVAALMALRIVISFVGTPSSYLLRDVSEPYAPVADGQPSFFLARRAAVYEAADPMPQYQGGLLGWQRTVESHLQGCRPGVDLRPLRRDGQLRFVVDSLGRVGEVQVLNVPDSLARQCLPGIARQLRFVPGYVAARPVSVRLTLPLK